MRRFDRRPLLAAAMLVTLIDACTDRFAYNYGDTDSAGAPAACIPAVPGCTDPDSQSCSSLNSCRAVNVPDDAGCLSTCDADPSWTDSDGDGCNAYRIGSCGFEGSMRACPML